ncbi:MAG: helix-turn-helix domain-containing protein [Cetobacterium sp.]|uniref:helix-turn-helix domain-containing protein n=1 Tax=Cetobacterium sp. TaxID=2071632 RepID=UPI003F3DF848
MSMLLMVKAMKARVGNSARKLVLLKLADNANDNGECWPSYQHIADHCEIDRRTAMRHINQLESDGFLRKEYRKGEKGNSSNVYHLTLDGGRMSLGGDRMSLGGGDHMSPRIYHSLEPINEPLPASQNDDDTEKKKPTRKQRFTYDKERIKATWNAKAEEHGLPKINAISATVEKGLVRLYQAHVLQCKQLGEKPNDIDDLINGYIKYGYEPTDWAKGANPAGKKYGITTALTQQKIDEILDAAR